MASLVLKNLNKVYNGDVLAVKDFNLEIQDGEFIVLVGPSGCGKTTTLRMIAGLEEISSGTLLIDGEDKTNAPPKDRNISMVFQNYALYAHMTVYENMAFSLSMRNENPKVIYANVMKAAEILGLTKELNKLPKQLSGGQCQRVALGRAIVRNPKVFLFDEPLSNLDAKLRGRMRRELKLLHQALNSTMIYVTHDQTEALTLADRIVCMSMGQVQQVGTPLELYAKPKNLFVAGFIGLPPMNIFDAVVTSEGLKMQDFTIPLKKPELEDYIGKEVAVGIRAEDVCEGEGVPFTLSSMENLGHSTLIFGQLNGKKTIFRLNDWQDYVSGQTISLYIDPKKVHIFDKQTTEAI